MFPKNTFSSSRFFVDIFISFFSIYSSLCSSCSFIRDLKFVSRCFKSHFRCSGLHSCSESIQQLNNRSTQIFSEYLDIIVGANGSQRLSAGSVVSLSLSLFMVFRKMSSLLKIFLYIDSIIDLKKVLFDEVVIFCYCFLFSIIPFDYL